MEDIFGDHLKVCLYQKKKIKTSRKQLKEIRDLFALSKPNLLEQLTKNVRLDGLFTLDEHSFNDDADLVTTYDPAYIFFFTMMYLQHLNKLLEEQLEISFGDDWRGKNIWYGVSVDKHLLGTVFGSTKKLEKLFYASGILDDSLRKAKFCNRGEEILPAIQHRLPYLHFKVKSYFVVAQLFSKHMQLTLHQVVKVASTGEDAASVIIKDKIVYMDDVFELLGKEIWTSIQLNCQMDYCNIHEDGKNERYDLSSFQTYSYMYRNIKSCVTRLVS